MVIGMGRRLYALIEVFLVYALILSVPIVIMPTINHFFPNFLGFTILGATPYTMISELSYLAIVLIALAVTRKDLLHSGVSLHNLRSDLTVAAICIIILWAFPLVIEFLPWNLIGINGSIWATILYSAIELLMLFVMAFVLTKVPSNEDKIAIGTFVFIPVVLLPSAGGISTFITSLIYYFIIFFVFVGPIEELVFRGYIQSRLNEAFDRPYRFFDISWGIGLIITALLFGIVHMTNYNFNPLIGNYSLDWLWGIEAFLTGLAFCFIREKTGNIVAPAIVHGALDFLSTMISYI